MCKLNKQFLLSSVMLLGLSLNSAHARFDPHSLPDELEGPNLVGAPKSKLPDYDWQVVKPQGTGQKEKGNIHKYFEQHPELLEKASKKLPKQVPLYEWVREFSEADTR